MERMRIPSGKNREGFTLIELLVVIAIIAILAAILFPVFVSARESARQSTCLSNLKQISMAIVMYSDNNSNKYPVQWASHGWPHTLYSVYPYVKKGSVFLCPTARKKGEMNSVTTSNPPEKYGLYWTSYATNAYFDYPSYYKPGISTMSAEMVRTPSKCVVVIDNLDPAEWTSYLGCERRSVIWWHNDGAGFGIMNSRQRGTRHNGGFNVGLVDGHAKWMKWTSDLLGGTTNSAIPVWNGFTFDPMTVPH